jgi:hypothetical protein
MVRRIRSLTLVVTAALALAPAAAMAQDARPGKRITWERMQIRLQERSRPDRAEPAQPRRAPGAVARHLPPRPRHRGDQEIVRERRMAGEIQALSRIEQRIVPRMAGARYIGSTFDPDSSVYTLKFMRDSSVIWVNVDGRTGRIIR